MIDLITVIGKFAVIGESEKTSIGVRATSEYGYISHLLPNKLTEGYYFTLEDGVVKLKNMFNASVSVNIMEKLMAYQVEDIAFAKYFSDEYTDHQPTACMLEDKFRLVSILSAENAKLKDIRRNSSLDHVILDERTSNVYHIETETISVFNYETLKEKSLESIPAHQILDDDLYRYKVIVYKNGDDWKKLNFYNLLANGID